MISPSIIFGILKKDYKELKVNTYLFFSSCIPIALAVFYHFASKNGTTVFDNFLILGCIYIFSIVLVVGSIISEEKEKYTLEGLVLSPASFLDILIGKNILSLGLAVFCVFVSFYLVLDYQFYLKPASFVLLCLSFIFYSLIGTLLGLFSKSVSQVNVYFIPIFIVFLVPLFYEPLSANHEILGALEYFPLAQEYKMAASPVSVFEFAALKSYSILLIWIAAALVLNIFYYRKVLTKE